MTLTGKTFGDNKVSLIITVGDESVLNYVTLKTEFRVKVKTY